jgi:hypothetical protein
MAKEYRIYPGIGIARLGNSPDSYFLAPEAPDVGPIELANDGAPLQPVRQYKDANHKLRRQGARFRVYEVTTDAAGAETFAEVTAGNGVEIVWRVELANEKAAAGWFTSEALPENTHRLRNPDASQTDLIIKPTFAPISGAKQTVVATTEGKFKGKTVYLGELRTDAQGRLIVLGGTGNSASVPANQPLGDGSQAQGHPPNDFANNWAWFDDVADGPVTAVVRTNGQDNPVAKSAWVIVAPPDFAPYTNGITTLYDIAVQAAGIASPARPSFQNDILPILRAASGLQWVSALPAWTEISTDYPSLSSNGAGSAQLRQDTRQQLQDIENNETLQNYKFTANQKAVLNAWADGNFNSDFQPNPPVPPLTPEGLNRASLTAGVGGGFFPGIEAGIRMTAPKMYSSPFRITDQPFVFAGVNQVPHAGFLTRTMAVPWQSDFFECEMQSPTAAWWPSQRPIDVYVDKNATVQRRWTDSIPNHQALVDKFALLGLVEKASGGKLVEAERDLSEAHTS